jgi:hypothetical protein
MKQAAGSRQKAWFIFNGPHDGMSQNMELFEM